MPMLVGTRRALLGAGRRLKYILRATFNAPDQGYADAQVIDTRAEGIQDGTLTVVEVDGTLAIVSNEMAFTAQGTTTWGDQGVYSQAITRALGRGLLGVVNVGATNKQTYPIGHWDGADLSLNNRVYTVHLDATAGIRAKVGDGAGVNLENPVVAAYSATTEYQFAILLGGHNVGVTPFYAGQLKANYDYGAWFFVKGGAFSTWTLLWVSALVNMATLYAGFSNYDAVGTLDDFRVPDKDLSAIQVPAAYSSFTAANGTSLDAITPEVGGAWTEQLGNWDIQGNEANCVAPQPAAPRYIATTDSGIADAIVDAIVTPVAASFPGLILRYADAANFWMLLAVDTANQFELYERNATVTTLRASAAIAIVAATPYQIRAIAYGQTIDGFLDGANKITYGVAALNENATIHGIRGGDVGDLCDNFAVMPRTSAQYDAVLGGV